MLQVQGFQGDVAQIEADCLVVNLFAGVTSPGAATGAVDQALGGAISQIIASGDFSGEAGSHVVLYTGGKIPAARVLVMGLGAADKFDLHATPLDTALADTVAWWKAPPTAPATLESPSRRRILP